jgi:hypothetical protein
MKSNHPGILSYSEEETVMLKLAANGSIIATTRVGSTIFLFLLGKYFKGGLVTSSYLVQVF